MMSLRMQYLYIETPKSMSIMMKMPIIIIIMCPPPYLCFAVDSNNIFLA